MAWSITLDFQDGGGARDVTEYVLKQSFRREWQWANGLSPASSQLRFAIQSNATIANLFLAATSTEVLVTVTKDGSGYFRGIVQNKFDVAVSTRLAPVEVMCVDRGELLRRKITSTFAWVGREVCTPDATDTSIVHQLLTLAGFASGDWNITEEIADEIAYFVVIASDDKTYWEILEELLGEFGYAFWFDADGDFRLGELAPATATSTQTFDETIVSGVLEASKRQQSYEAVEVEWAPNLSLANQVVFSDTTGGTEANKAYIPVAAGDWYPESVETYDVFSEYRIDGREVIYCASPSIDWSGETGLSLDTFTNYYRRALIKIQNTAGAEKHITKLDVVGTVVVRGDPSFTKVEFVTNSEKIEKITTRWITTQAQATFLASLRSRFYEYGHIEYRWQSRTLVTPGAIVTLQDPILGMDNLVRVQSRSDNEVTGIATYAGYGLAAYTAETPDTSGIHTTPGTRTVDDRVDGLPTFDDLEDGWDASGGSGTNGTQTPSVPTVTAHGLYKAIVIEWDRQTYLTNFARYEVQVSDDAGTTWYSLDFDGDGVGTAAADTDCVVERLTHSRIPFGGTEDAPTGTTYHYRVRRVTRAAVASDWSDAASATTLTIDTGDIAENSITTNKLVTGLLNTMVAEVLSYLEVSDTLGWLAGAYTTPVSGNQRAYLDKNEFRLQIHNGSSWLDRFVVAASDATDDYVVSAIPAITADVSVDTIKARTSGGMELFEDGGSKGIVILDAGYAKVTDRLCIDTETPSAPIQVGSATINSTDAVFAAARVLSDGSGNAHAFTDSTDLSRSGGIGYNSFDARIDISGTANFDHYAGFQFAPTFSGSGTIGDIYGIYIDVPVPTGGGTITNNWAIYVKSRSGVKSHVAGNVELEDAINFVDTASCPSSGIALNADGYLYMAGGSNGLKFVDYSGDLCMTIADGGAVTIAQNLTLNESLVLTKQLVQNTYAKRAVFLKALTDNSATAVFTITTTDETGSADGGGYACFVRGVIFDGAYNASACATVSFEAHFARAMASAGSGDNSAVTEISESTCAATASGTRFIGTVTMTVTETSEFVQTVNITADHTGSGSAALVAVLDVEVVYYGFQTAPQLANA